MPSLYFDRPEMKYQKFTLQNMSAACEKQMAFCVMLGTARTRTARTLDVFLELKPRFTPPAVLSFHSLSRPSCILCEDQF